MDKHDIPFLGDFYTKSEVDAMVAAAVEEARAIDEASMAEHNFKATIISMVLGFICLALFVDGLLRILGIIPPFAGLDVNILDTIAEKTTKIVERDLAPVLNKIPRIYSNLHAVIPIDNILLVLYRVISKLRIPILSL